MYWEHVLNRFSLMHITPRNTPLPVGIILDSNMSPKTHLEKKSMQDKPYPTEAEYVAMSRCAQQMVWMHSWLSEVKMEYTCPGVIKGDNRGAIALTKNTRDHGKVISTYSTIIFGNLYSQGIL